MGAGSVLLVGIDPVDVFAYGPQVLSGLAERAGSVEVVVDSYFQPSPTYWDALSAASGGVLSIAGLAACSVTQRFMRAAVERLGGLRLYTPLACRRALEARAARVGGGVAVEAVRVWGFWKTALSGGEKASLWRLTRYAAAYGDWDGFVSLLTRLVWRLAEEAGSEEVDRERHVAEARRRLESLVPGTPGAAASRYMNTYMEEERVDGGFEVYRITRRPGPRLPFTPVVANLRARASGKTVIIRLPDVNLDYFTLSTPKGRGSWSTSTALREAGRRGLLRAKIHVESPEYAEGLALVTGH